METSDGRQWFRLYRGAALLADNLRTQQELERELERYGLALADFTPED